MRPRRVGQCHLRATRPAGFFGTFGGFWLGPLLGILRYVPNPGHLSGYRTFAGNTLFFGNRGTHERCLVCVCSDSFLAFT